MRKAVLILVSFFMLTSQRAYANTDYTPPDVIVKEGLVYVKNSGQLLKGKIVIKDGPEPSFVEVDNGVINQLFIANNNVLSKYYYQNKKKHLVDVKGANKPMDIKYINGALSDIYMQAPSLKMNAAFDKNANVIEFESVYSKNDLQVSLQDQVITYVKISSKKTLKRLDIHDEKYQKSYRKMNGMFRKIDASVPSYESVIRMLQIPTQKRNTKVSLAKCQKLLGDKEFNRVKELLDGGPALAHHCNTQAKAK